MMLTRKFSLICAYRNLQLLGASHKPSHCTSARAVRLSQYHLHRQSQPIAYMCLLAGLFAVQETARTGQSFLVASGEHPSWFQKEPVYFKLSLGALRTCSKSYSLTFVFGSERDSIARLCKQGLY